MQIEAGKYYRTRDGRKAGPMVRPSVVRSYPWYGAVGGESGYVVWFKTEDGRLSGYSDNPCDLIAEWVDEPTVPSPVRTVTRKEIVPGTYGWIDVGGRGTYNRDKICVRFHETEGPFGSNESFNRGLSASELRAAAKVFTDLADALDQGGE